MKNYMYKIKKGNLHDDAMAAAKATSYTNVKGILGSNDLLRAREAKAIVHAIQFYNDQASGKAQTDFWKDTLLHAPIHPAMFQPEVAVTALKAEMRDSIAGLLISEFCPPCMCTSHNLKTCPGKKKLDEAFKGNKGYRA